jgi:TldD protein
MARRNGFGRSNGCSFAESAGHVPMLRMPNVSLQPSAAGRGTDELIGEVDDGIYVVGDKSWSIDMQRLHFQFTGQRFYRIHAGRLAGQLRDIAYQATTTEFWGSLAEVGGPQSYRLCGADLCGKAQPTQIAAASHGTPAALFRGVSVLNPAQELGR